MSSLNVYAWLKSENKISGKDCTVWQYCSWWKAVKRAIFTDGAYCRCRTSFILKGMLNCSKATENKEHTGSLLIFPHEFLQLTKTKPGKTEVTVHTTQRPQIDVMDTMAICILRLTEKLIYDNKLEKCPRHFLSVRKPLSLYYYTWSYNLFI